MKSIYHVKISHKISLALISLQKKAFNIMLAYMTYNIILYNYCWHWNKKSSYCQGNSDKKKGWFPILQK